MDRIPHTFANCPIASACFVLSALHSMANVLNYLHSQEATHGDLKPANFLVTKEGPGSK